jgi:hypothetical protein
MSEAYQSAQNLSSIRKDPEFVLLRQIHLFISTSLQRGDKVIPRNANSRVNGFSKKPFERVGGLSVSIATSLKRGANEMRPNC